MKKGIVLIIAFIGLIAFSGCKEAGIGQSAYDEAYKNAKLNQQDVREISYEEFMRIRNHKEGYVLLDVLSMESFNKNHIPRAESFPLDTINKESAEKRIIKEAKVVVYCGGFGCHASTAAAKALSSLGYKVLDYKGGLEEWGGKGNKFASVE